MNRQIFQYHPVVGYQFVPGIKARLDHETGGYLMRTNQAGFRCRHEFVKERREGVSRVLLFGDSYTAGDGVSDKYRYSELLEKLIPGIEVYNFGLSGSGTDQQYLIWREFARDIEHDVVVISVLVENIRRVVVRYRPFQTQEGETRMVPKPYFTLAANGKLSLHHVPVPQECPAEKADGAADKGGRFPWLRQQVNRMGPKVKDVLQALSGYQPVPGFDRADHPDWRLLEAILLRWVAELDKNVVIFPIPLYQHVEENASATAYQARFASLAAPPRVLVHDPLSDMQRVPLAERRGYRFQKDCHPTPSAHEVLAKSLARCIGPMLNKSQTFPLI